MVIFFVLRNAVVGARFNRSFEFHAAVPSFTDGCPVAGGYLTDLTFDPVFGNRMQSIQQNLGGLEEIRFFPIFQADSFGLRGEGRGDSSEDRVCVIYKENERGSRFLAGGVREREFNQNDCAGRDAHRIGRTGRRRDCRRGRTVRRPMFASLQSPARQPAIRLSPAPRAIAERCPAESIGAGHV